MQESWVRSLGREDPLETEMATHSSTLAWQIPWEELGRLQSTGSLRVGHDWATSLSLFTFHFHALEKEMATHSSVLAWRIPEIGKPGGLPSVGSHRVGHDWSDLAAAAAAELELGMKHSCHLWLKSYKMSKGLMSEWAEKRWIVLSARWGHKAPRPSLWWARSGAKCGMSCLCRSGGGCLSPGTRFRWPVGSLWIISHSRPCEWEVENELAVLALRELSFFIKSPAATSVSLNAFKITKVMNAYGKKL